QFNLLDYFLSEERLLEIGDRTAFEVRDSQKTYNELRAEVDNLVWRIVNCGVSEGDRVALLLYDSIEFVSCFLATVSIGAVAVPVNTFLPGHDVAFILSDSRAKLLVVESELEDKVSLNDAAGNRPMILKVDTRTRTCFEPGDRE